MEKLIGQTPYQVVLLGDPTTGAPVSPGGGGGPVTIADGADVAEGAKADAPATDNGPWSVVSLLKAIRTAVTGVLPVGGNVASGAADTGNGVKISGVYSGTLPAFVSGNRGDIQVSVGGAVLTTAVLGTAAGDGFGNTSVNYLINRSGFAAMPITAVSYFNGTNWDRARGDSQGQFTKQPPVALTDRSIAATTTSQQAAAANTLRNKFRVQNISTTGDLWYNFGAAAVVNGLGSFKLVPGAYLDDQGTNQALFVIASTGTVNATIKEA